MSMRKVLSILGLGVEYHRVAEHLIGVVAHLDTLYGLKLVGLCVVVATIGLKEVIILLHVAAATKLTDRLCGVELTVVGIHHSAIINNLHKA